MLPLHVAPSLWGCLNGGTWLICRALKVVIIITTIIQMIIIIIVILIMYSNDNTVILYSRIQTSTVT